MGEERMTRCTCHDVLIVKDLNRWFKEKWVDISRKDKDGKHPPCGRSKAKLSGKGYPKCRPSIKVSDKTPRTSGSMSEGEKQAATKRKRAKKQGVGGKPTVVKAMKDEEKKGKKGMVMVIAITAKPNKKVGVKKSDDMNKLMVGRDWTGSPNQQGGGNYVRCNNQFCGKEIPAQSFSCPHCGVVQG